MKITNYKLNSQYIKRLKGYAKSGERVWIVAGSGSGKSWLASKVGGWDLDLSAEHVTQPDGKSKWTLFLPRIPTDAKIVSGCFAIPREDVFMAYWKPTRIVFIKVSQSRYEETYLWKIAAKRTEARFKLVLDPLHPIKKHHKIENLEGSNSQLYADNVTVYLDWIHNKEIGPKDIPVDIVTNDFDSFEGSAWHGDVTSWGSEVLGLMDIALTVKEPALLKKVRALMIKTALDPRLNLAYRTAARWITKLNPGLVSPKELQEARSVMQMVPIVTVNTELYTGADGKAVRAWDVSTRLKAEHLKSVGLTDAQVKAGKLIPSEPPNPGGLPSALKVGK